MRLKSVFYFFVYHFFPIKRLEDKLTGLLSRNGFTFQATFSGKVGLFRIANQLKNQPGDPSAVVPDYICNVIHIALEKAGFHLSSYPTNELLETSKDELLKAIEQKQPKLLLFASVFGSSASLPLLDDPDIRAKILAIGTHVVIDICQDITLIDRLPADYGTGLSAIVSFNNKSFPGAMGGGVLTKREISVSPPELAFKQKLALYRFLLREWHKCKSHVHAEKGCQFEYAYCVTFPYQVREFRPCKLQLVMALIGIKNIAYYLSRKAAFLEGKDDHFIPMHFIDSSPYLIVNRNHDNKDWPRRNKSTYAIHGALDESLHPDWVIIHNKGFCDE